MELLKVNTSGEENFWDLMLTGVRSCLARDAGRPLKRGRAVFKISMEPGIADARPRKGSRHRVKPTASRALNPLRGLDNYSS